MKNKKNGKTQSFLEVVDREVLIFWCLKRVRWKKSCLSRFCQNGGLAPVWLGHAFLRSVWELSWSVWRHLAVSVGVFLFLDVWRGVSIDLGDIFGMPELLGSVFGDSLHEGLAQTGANSLFWPNPKRQEFFTYLFWDIKISKPHYMPFLKSFDIFLNFHVRQREITIHSLFWSPCISQTAKHLKWRWELCPYITLFWSIASKPGGF